MNRRERIANDLMDLADINLRTGMWVRNGAREQGDEVRRRSSARDREIGMRAFDAVSEPGWALSEHLLADIERAAASLLLSNRRLP